VAYQEVDGERREVSAGYVLKGRRQVGFEVGDHDPTRPLVIDHSTGTRRKDYFRARKFFECLSLSCDLEQALTSGRRAG